MGSGIPIHPATTLVFGSHNGRTDEPNFGVPTLTVRKREFISATGRMGLSHKKEGALVVFPSASGKTIGTMDHFKRFANTIPREISFKLGSTPTAGFAK